MTDFQLSTAQRKALVGEMLKQTDRNKAHRLAIETLVAWYDGGQQGQEPFIEDLPGISWKIGCAISTDVRHIFKVINLEFPYGSQYAGEYVKLRREAARKAAQRREAKLAAENGTGMDLLRAKLTL